MPLQWVIRVISACISGTLFFLRGNPATFGRRLCRFRTDWPVKARIWLILIGLLAAFAWGSAPSEEISLAGTDLLTPMADPAAEMVAGIHRFLDARLEASVEERKPRWHRVFSSWEAYETSVAGNRKRLGEYLGAVDRRVGTDELLYVGGTGSPHQVLDTGSYTVHRVRWPVLPGVDGEGLLAEPKGRPVASVIAVPDADQTPEMLMGLTAGIPEDARFARRLADAGCRVMVPALLSRDCAWSGTREAGYTDQSHREWIYRQAFHLGRHIIGFEIEKLQSVLDWFQKAGSTGRIGVAGYGEGGLLALCTAALDVRVDAALVSGYFDSRQDVWKEPLYRNVWGLLHEFGDAEIASLVAPRTLIVEYSPVPQERILPEKMEGRRRTRAPGELVTPPLSSVRKEFERARSLFPASLKPDFLLVSSAEGKLLEPGSREALDPFLRRLGGAPRAGPSSILPVSQPDPDFISERQHRQVWQLQEFCQELMRRSDEVRQAFWADAKVESPEQWNKAVQSYRDYYWEEIVGKFAEPSLPFNPRTRVIYRQPRWTGYEVKLDVWPDVFAYGILLVPNDLKPGEKRPVVVAQHGLEGTPVDVANPIEDTRAYHSFAARLADRGFVVYAPQNPYRGEARFRMLNRKANPIKKTFFGVIVRQHQQTVEWLSGLPFVDSGRIGFYGLSYGGVSAMRLPPLIDKYALSICSANFNDWVYKVGSIRLPLTYLYHAEFDMFSEFNIANRFNYSDLARLIAPRPFMVERGYLDGAGTDAIVAGEYALVRAFYARLGIPERTEIELFMGGHEINSKGTFAFLEKFLDWQPR